MDNTTYKSYETNTNNNLKRNLIINQTFDNKIKLTYRQALKQILTSENEYLLKQRNNFNIEQMNRMEQNANDYIKFEFYEISFQIYIKLFFYYFDAHQLDEAIRIIDILYINILDASSQNSEYLLKNTLFLSFCKCYDFIKNMCENFKTENLDKGIIDFTIVNTKTAELLHFIEDEGFNLNLQEFITYTKSQKFKKCCEFHINKLFKDVYYKKMALIKINKQHEQEKNCICAIH